MTDDILIFAEQRDNRIHPAALQLVTPARALADKTGGQVVACVVGDQIDTAAAAMNVAGVNRIITISNTSLAVYSATRYRTALVAAAEKVQPRVLLLPASFMGRDLSPRVAARLSAGLGTDVVELDLDGDGALEIHRPIYNGKASAKLTFARDRLAIATVRANTFPAPTDGGAAATESLAFTPGAGDDRITVKGIERAGGEVKDVAEADIIVAGGRALKNEQNFALLYKLAKELDAAVGASRAACDAGYQPHSRQVGLTGKTVTPKLYIAAGISGAIQHLAGMRGSKVIVNINTDPEAPLAQVADYTIQHDLFKVIPALTAEVRALKAQS
ncbi:MAG: electron transfer flavoprotein subunit alpha/FixB family protein [Phycisphaerae bacterium]|nr:electron transfer flavoprotein subunit alpha/FixB family protein [Phycisphaerae bacterium]